MGHVVLSQKFWCDGADTGVDWAVRNHRAEFGIRLANGPLVRVEIQVSRQPRLRQLAPRHLFVEHELPQGVQSIRARKPACHADDRQRLVQRSVLVLEVQSDIPIPPTVPRTMGRKSPEHAGGWVLIQFSRGSECSGEQTTHPWINTTAEPPVGGLPHRRSWQLASSPATAITQRICRHFGPMAGEVDHSPPHLAPIQKPEQSRERDGEWDVSMDREVWVSRNTPRERHPEKHPTPPILSILKALFPLANGPRQASCRLNICSHPSTN